MRNTSSDSVPLIFIFFPCPLFVLIPSSLKLIICLCACVLCWLLPPPSTLPSRLHIFAAVWSSHCVSLCFLLTLSLTFFSIPPLLSPRGMQLSWCILHWLINATWLWPRPWRWALGGTLMGLLAQARPSRSKPWGGCSDARFWCSTVMR